MYRSFLFFVIVVVVNGDGTGRCSKLDCSHGCKELTRIAICICPDDLFLGVDSKTCLEPSSLLLLTTSGLKVFKKGSDEILNNVPSVRGYAFDYLFSKHEIFAYIDDKINRYAFNDSSLSALSSKTPIVEVDTRVTSLTVDWVNSKLYWICSQRSLVETAGTDGSGRKELASYPSGEDSLLSSWDDITVDPYAGKLFWLGVKGLYISDLNGHYSVTILKTLRKEHLAVDTNNQLIYIIGNYGYNTSEDKVIVRYRYDGSQVGEAVSLGQPSSTVFSFGVVEHTIYWLSNYNGENIYKADIKNLSVGKKDNLKATVVAELYQVVRNFKIYQPEIQHAPKLIK